MRARAARSALWTSARRVQGCRRRCLLACSAWLQAGGRTAAPLLASSVQPCLPLCLRPLPLPPRKQVLGPNGDWWWFDTCHCSVADVQILSSNSVSSGEGVYWMFYSGGSFEPVQLPAGMSQVRAPWLRAVVARRGCALRRGPGAAARPTAWLAPPAGAACWVPGSPAR